MRGIVFLLALLLVLSSCTVPQEEPEETSNGFVFSDSAVIGYWWLEGLTDDIKIENGILEIPQTDDQGNVIVGIGASAIINNEEIEEIFIGDNIEWISRGGISNLPNLKTVHIGKNLNDISVYLFYNCPNLKNVVIHPENPHFKFEGNCLLSKDGTKLLRAWNDSYQIPPSVTVIGAASFVRAHFLTSISLPEGITTVESCAFAECVNLREVYFPQTITTLDFIFGAWGKDITAYFYQMTDVTSFYEGWDRIDEGETLKIVFMS